MEIRFHRSPKLLLYTVCALAALGPAYPRDKLAGQITGTAVDQRGNPVPHLTVSVDLMDDKPRAMPMRNTVTDQNGRFQIDGLGFGTYKLYSAGEDNGYPTTYFSFYTGAVPPPRANLTPQSPTASVSLVVGPKAAHIVGIVQDAVTGAPLSAGFHMWRTKNPDDWVDVGGKPQFDILVPAATDVSFDVHAEGYQSWHYPSGSASPPSGSLRLKSEEKMTVNVYLEPAR